MIMILTGKCKEDFNKWNYDNYFGYIDHEPTSLVVHFEDLDENLQNSIIVDFFDSVGIFIFIEHTSFFRVPKFEAKVITNDDFIILNRHEKRSEATKQAIINANKIYNENKA